MTTDKEKILLVDDDEKNLILLEERLKMDTREFTKATSGKEALDILKNDPDYYLVVMDVNMPGLDGFDVAEVILSQENTKDLPILFVTASQISDISAERGYRVGAVDYITKPINPVILECKVAVFLRLSRQRRQLKEINVFLDREKQKAEAASAAKSTFLQNMSHSLLTPMNGIVGFLHLLEQEGKGKLSESEEELIDIARNSTSSLTQIFMDILEFSSADIGKIILAESEFGIEALIDSAIDPVKPESVRKGLKIIKEIPQNIPHKLVGDVARLRQILYILIENAVKFTEAGSVKVRVKAEPEEANIRLHFEVQDSGIGMENEFYKSIFDPFFQIDDSLTRSSSGIGIGLGIAKKVTEIMKGSLYVESEIDKGSTFHFVVTIKESPPKD